MKYRITVHKTLEDNFVYYPEYFDENTQEYVRFKWHDDRDVRYYSQSSAKHYITSYHNELDRVVEEFEL